MRTSVTNELRAKTGRGDDVLALSSRSPRRVRDGRCQHISIRCKQDNPDVVVGMTKWRAPELDRRTLVEDGVWDHCHVRRDARRADEHPISVRNAAVAFVGGALD